MERQGKDFGSATAFYNQFWAEVRSGKLPSVKGLNKMIRQERKRVEALEFGIAMCVNSAEEYKWALETYDKAWDKLNALTAIRREVLEMLKSD